MPLRAQCPDGSPPPCAGAAVLRGSIAVLPFANRSPDTGDAYLATEFPEQIGGRLSRLPQLHVTSATAVAAQWRRTPDALAAARALRVEWLVTGALRRSSTQVTASVELVRTATGEQAWSSLLRRGDGDIAAIEIAVAESVAVAAAGRLARPQREALVRRDSRNPEAYRLYLFAKAMMARRTVPALEEAAAALGRAEAIEPAFAGAFARLGQVRTLQAQYGSAEGLGYDSARVLARAQIDRALALDSASSDAWLALGMWYGESFDVGESARALDRASRLDSLDADIENATGYLYGIDLLMLPDLAEAHYRRAVQLNPDLRSSWRQLGWVFAGRGLLATAIAYLDTSLANGAWRLAYQDRAWMRYANGDVPGALADRARADSVAPRPLLPLFVVQDSASDAVFAMARGDSAGALRILRDPRQTADVNAGRAIVAMALGRREDAVAALQQVRSGADAFIPMCAPATPCSASIRTWQLLNDPLFQPLRSDPRCERLWTETRPRLSWRAEGNAP